MTAKTSIRAAFHAPSANANDWSKPSKPVAKVHAIADRIAAKNGGFADRPAVLRACAKIGIAYNTAATQFNVWAKRNAEFLLNAAGVKA